MFFVNIGPDSKRQRENGENLTIRRIWVCINRCFHLSPLKSTLPNRHISITRSIMLQICVISSEHLILSSVRLHHLPPLLSQLMTLQLFFTEKTKAISSQFSPPLTQNLQSTRSTAQTPIFSFCPITEAEVSKLLLSSHPTTCPLDPIPSHLLQTISPTLLPALTHIINTSLLTGIFPTAFKQARVTPLLKKPTLNTSLLENYRPVSLLPFIAKTLKRVVFNQVSLFLSQNNKLDAKQSGFRSGHSTETALLSVALRIAKADSKSSVLILLDLSAAFDTVNHQILLSTLSSLDITGIPLRWFESYLTGRSFRVAWHPKHINWSLGFPRDRFLDPSFSPHALHHWLPSYRHIASPTISTLMTHSSISHFDQMIQR